MKKSLFVAAIAAISLVACKKGDANAENKDSIEASKDSAVEAIDSAASAGKDSVKATADSAKAAVDSTAKTAAPAAH
ncbi:hypothetical protein [Chryseobacterium foetidum]|uniref:hypothetical protein n=1 Tax=Chryseobacterium foetidum TaxID=2951057 RepID=UPI0021C8A270|nr:hypothetical protein [Chryseobacterium foetidum]